MSKELLPPCRYCHNMNHMEDIKCAEACHSLDEFNDYIEQAISANNTEWRALIKEAWHEYVIYPITIDVERSSGNTQVVFDRKPEFPEFLIKLQERKKPLEGEK